MITKICSKHKCEAPLGKCPECDIDSSTGRMIPCSSPIEDSSSIFWCKNCNVPSFFESCSKCGEKLDTLCGNKAKRISSDIRPVFPEEKLLLAIMLKKAPDFYQKSSVWCSPSTYIIDGKKEKISITKFNKLSIRSW